MKSFWAKPAASFTTGDWALLLLLCAGIVYVVVPLVVTPTVDALKPKS